MRRSATTASPGSPGAYIEHPIHTALFLGDLRLDADTISAALLHDVMEDCGVTYAQLSKKFGDEIAKLVDGVTKLTRMDIMAMDTDDSAHASGVQDRLKAESLRKMLVAMAQDIRVVLIKLADRLHNMRTLEALSAERRQAIARETWKSTRPWPTGWAYGTSSGAWRTSPSGTWSPFSTRRYPGCSRPSVANARTT